MHLNDHSDANQRTALSVRLLRRIFCGRAEHRIALAEAQFILVIRPDEIGDIVLTIPFLRELRRAAPRARIALVVNATCYELVEHSPYADAVYALNFKQYGGKLYCLRLTLAALQLRWSRLRRWKFDLVLLPRRGPDNYRSEL